MDPRHRSFRLIAIATATALLLGQGAPPPTAAPAAADPPARVGRLAQVSGAVSFHGADDNQWSRATPNYPVSQGSAFWTEPNAQAVIEVSASRIAMAPGTELDVTTLSDTDFQATEPQGELYLDVQAARPGETYAVQTPRGLVTLTAPGRYGVAAGDVQNPTTVTAIEGSAHVEGPGVSLDVGAGQTGNIAGTDSFQGQVAPAQRDAFLTAMLDRERPSQPRGAVPPAVAALPGGDDLSRYGAWGDRPDYGLVWYPEVPPDWAPYRDGSWAYVAPWGWTWVDSEPWGFAPFHYGRWVEIDGRWAWVPDVPPGPPAPPVYAPALVTFFGLGAAAAGIGIGAALANQRIGWLPLGPREPYRPWYPASERYLQRVNVAHPPGAERDRAISDFANRRAATVVPGSAMAASRPVGGAFQRVDPAQLAQLRPMAGGQQPIRPAPTAMGVTPVVARQLNLPPPLAGSHTVAPGPAIRTTPAGIAAGAIPMHPFTAAPAPHMLPAPGQIAPPAVQREPGFAGQGAVPHLPPVVNHGGGGGPPPAQLYRAPGAIFQQSAPPAAFHPAAPQPPVVHAPSPVVVRAPPQVAHTPPVTRAEPAMVHAAPAPQVHAPAAAPVAHTPPPGQNAAHKRPGEP